MTTTADVRSLAGAVNRARPEVDAVDRRLISGLYQTLGKGEPAPLADLASATGIAPDEVAARLDKWPGVFRDEAGRVVGFWGLTVREMPPHEVFVDGRRLWAWCAWDTLFLPRRLGATLDVLSLCPTTRTPISLRVSPDAVESVVPDSVVVSFLQPTRPFAADVIGSFCHFVHFFVDRQAGEDWTGEHPGTFLVSLDDAFEVGRLTDEDLFGKARQP